MPSEVMFMHDTCTRTYSYKSIHIYTYIDIHQLPEHVRMCLRTYVRMCVWKASRVRMCVPSVRTLLLPMMVKLLLLLLPLSIYVYIYIHIYTRIYVRIYIPPNMPSEVMFMHDTCTRTYTYIYVHTYIYIYVYIFVHQPPEHVCMCVRTYVRMRVWKASRVRMCVPYVRTLLLPIMVKLLLLLRTSTI